MLADGEFNGYVCLSLVVTNTYIHIDLEIGFKDTSYQASEEERSFSFEVEVKNSGLFAAGIDFTVTDIEGKALSESFWILAL